MRTGRLLFVLIAGLCFARCRGGSRSEARAVLGASVVLISVDTLRADHLPAYGYRGVETPHLDALRKDSILYENAYSHCPLTLPSHASILTGLLPPIHGVRDNLGYRLDAQAHPTLAMLLKAKGYATGAAVSAYVVRGETGLKNSFDFYDDAVEPPAGGESVALAQRRGGETAKRALSWLASVRTRPFFLFFHIYEPHLPYDPPEPFKSRYPLAYDGEIATSDEIVGELLDDLKRDGTYDKAVIVFLSDHGEGLGDHGEADHGILLYREVLRVPLLLKLPGGERAGMSVKRPVALIDVLPTVTALLGLKTPEALKGRSLVDETEDPSRRIYAETYYPRIHLGWSDLRSLLDARYHFIEAPRPELYDMLEDPRERTNILPERTSSANAMKAALSRYATNFALPGEIDPASLERLKALGYLGGVSSTDASKPLPDPKDNLSLISEIKRGFTLSSSGRGEEALVVFKSLLEKNPHIFDVQLEVGDTLARLGRNEEALRAYRAAVRISPSLAEGVALSVAKVSLELGNLQDAEASAKLASRTNPARAHEILARVALKREDLFSAEREVKLIAGDPEAPLRAAVLVAEVRIRRGDLKGALKLLEEARERLLDERLRPTPDLEFLRGDVLARLERRPEAVAAFREEIRQFPRNSLAYARLAIVYALDGRTVREVHALLEEMEAANPGPATALLAAKTLESVGDHAGAAVWKERAGTLWRRNPKE